MATMQKGIDRLQASLTEMRSVVRDMTPAEADIRVSICADIALDAAQAHSVAVCDGQLPVTQVMRVLQHARQMTVGDLTRALVVQKQLQAIELDYQADEDIEHAIQAQSSSMHLDIEAAEGRAASLQVPQASRGHDCGRA